MKILILGAGIYQVPLIKKAKEMGHFVMVASIRGNYPGFTFADKCVYLDTTDREAILSFASSERIDAIVTTGTDVAVQTIGYVCEQLHLNGISGECAELVTDKAKMKEALWRGGVRTAPFYRVHDLAEAYQACEAIKFPVVFKCVDRSGSRGICRADTPFEVPEAYDYAWCATNAPYILVEKHLVGMEIGLDGFVTPDAEFYVPHAKRVYHNGLTDVPTGHELPFEAPLELHKDILEQGRLAARAVKLENGFFNMDIMISDGKCHIIEIGARTGATCIPEVISGHYGIDYYELMIHHALGQPLAVPQNPRQACVGELLISEKSGILKEIEIGDAGNALASHISFDYRPGESVRRFHVGPDRIGQILVCGNTLSEVHAKLALARQEIQLVIE